MNPLPKTAGGARRQQIVARIKTTLPKLTAPELRELGKTLLAALEVAEASATPAKDRTVDQKPSVVYRKELVRCGKEGCKCSEGELHGPYWYGYYRSPRSGRVVKKYLGKEKRELRVR